MFVSHHSTADRVHENAVSGTHVADVKQQDVSSDVVHEKRGAVVERHSCLEKQMFLLRLKFHTLQCTCSGVEKTTCRHFEAVSGWNDDHFSPGRVFSDGNNAISHLKTVHVCSVILIS